MATLEELTVRIGADAEDLEKETSSAAQTVEDNIGKITASGVAAGAGMEAFARGQGDANEVLGRTSVITGESEDALRGLAVELSDGQTAASDNAAAFELLAQKGFDTKQEMEELTPEIGQLADAVGKDMPEAIESADRLLVPFGDDLSDVGENADQMSRLMAETDVPIGTLERNLGRVPDELQDLEFGLDDAAAGIEYFRDQGYSGQESVREFRGAVADSEGDMDAFLESVGMTAEEFEEYQDAVEPAAGLTDDLAEANGEASTPMQELQQHAENLMFEYGDLATLAGNLAPVLMALGPIFKGLALAKGLFSAALWASPITWIILGIIALIAVIVLIIVYWDEIAEATAAVWDWIVDKLSEAWEWIKDLFSDAWEWLVDTVTGLWESISEGFQAGVDWIVDLVSGLWETVAGFFSDAWEWLVDLVTGIWDSIVDFFQDGIDGAIDLVEDGVDSVLDFFSEIGEVPGMVAGFFSDMVSSAADFISDLLSDVGAIPGDITSALGDLGSLLLDAGQSVIQGLIDGITGMISGLGDTMSDVASTVRDYLPFSPAAEGPLSGGGAPEVSGASIAESLGEGVLDEMRAVDQAADALMSPLDERMGDLSAGMRDDVSRDIPSNVNAAVRGSGGDPTRVVFDVSGADEEFKKVIRRMVKVDGQGDVQTAFGKGSR